MLNTIIIEIFCLGISIWTSSILCEIIDTLMRHLMFKLGESFIFIKNYYRTSSFVKIWDIISSVLFSILVYFNNYMYICYFNYIIEKITW